MVDINEMDENILQGKTLLVVDDETDLRDIVASEMEFMGAQVFQAENVMAAQKTLTQQTIDLVISDIRMPGGTGIDLLDHIKTQNVHTPPVILITGFADITPEDAYDKGAEALMNKPFKLDDLVQTVALQTMPLEERLSHTQERPTQKIIQNFTQSLQETLKEGTLKVGRGGVSFIYKDQGNKFDLSRPLAFEINFKDFGLKGIAHCRWLRAIEQEQGHAIGLEFLQLEKASQDFFVNYIKDRSMTAYLPAIKI